MSLLERPSLEGVIDVPSARLSAAELGDVVRQVLEAPDAWRPHVLHDPIARHYVSLHESEWLGVWLICWMPGHDTGWHDHADSNGSFGVAEGVLREDRPVWGAPSRRVEARAGDRHWFDETEIHRVACVGTEPTVSIHAYSKPLTRMGMYRVEADGYLRRRDVSWDERLTD